MEWDGGTSEAWLECNSFQNNAIGAPRPPESQNQLAFKWVALLWFLPWLAEAQAPSCSTSFLLTDTWSLCRMQLTLSYPQAGDARRGFQ